MESADATTINTLGLLITIIFGFSTVFLPREYASVPFLAIGVAVTLGQIWNVAGLHFSIMRIMVLAGMVRVMVRGEFRGIKTNEIDKALILWAVANVIFFTLREGTSSAFINRLGFAYNALGIYFVFRFLVRTEEDIRKVLKALAILVIPLALMMLYEKATGRNLYSYFGGVEEYTWVRDGRLRCQGPFRHAILAGTFGAVSIPLFAGLWLSGRERIKTALATAAATFIVYASASGGAILSFATAWIALAAWKIRANLRAVRWGIFAAVMCLHLVMKAPVWYLIGRASEIVGGTGWHRSELINQFLMRWDEWWLAGTSETAHWMPYTLSLYEKADITNHFISQGVDGGLVTLLLFIVLVAYALRRVGLALREKGKSPAPMREAFWVWGLGTSLVTHVVSFLGVSYFDQMVIYWYSLLAMIAALTVTASVPVTKEGSSGFLMGRYNILWFYRSCKSKRSISEMITIACPKRSSRPSPSGEVLRTSALTSAFRPCGVESRPMARGWPFKAFDSGMHSFFSAQPQHIGATHEKPGCGPKNPVTDLGRKREPTNYPTLLISIDPIRSACKGAGKICHISLRSQRTGMANASQDSQSLKPLNLLWKCV